MFMIGYYNAYSFTPDELLGNHLAKATWVYMVFPFIGAILASVFYILHHYIDSRPPKQTEPMQFMQSDREQVFMNG